MTSAAEAAKLFGILDRSAEALSSIPRKPRGMGTSALRHPKSGYGKSETAIGAKIRCGRLAA